MVNPTTSQVLAPATNTDPSTGGGKKAARGFAAMDPAQQRRIASEGGRAAHASGNAHEFTSEEARAAGSKSRGGRGAKQATPASDNNA
ncbi:MAG: hypothetical protein JWQ88_2557 [Rhodoferax sp.]|nr:hypothetical protein [Rhodoferax sp.]